MTLTLETSGKEGKGRGRTVVGALDTQEGSTDMKGWGALAEELGLRT